MQNFIKDDDYDRWEIISNGDFIPTSKKEDTVEPKSRLEYIPRQSIKELQKFQNFECFIFLLRFK